jgi:hypothetical protein
MHLFANELALKPGIRGDVDLTIELPIVCELANQFLLSVPPPGFDPEECDDMLAIMLRNTSSSLRVEVAERLAHVSDGPERSVRLLAYDKVPAVAVPVLRYSQLLPESDLAPIARMRSGRGLSEEHLIAIARRPDLGSRLTDILTSRGTPPVLNALAENGTARFTMLGLCRMAMRSGKIAFSAVPLEIASQGDDQALGGANREIGQCGDLHGRSMRR